MSPVCTESSRGKHDRRNASHPSPPGNSHSWLAEEASNHRAGIFLPIVALILVLLLGMVGLVVDGGLLMAGNRRVLNAADAGATAAAMDMLRGLSANTARDTATAYVKTNNALADATVTVNIPPASGPYAGNSHYVEVIVSNPVQTYLVQLLGLSRNRTVSARSVAGYERVPVAMGVAVLNPTARPGLEVNGNGVLRVQGRVVVNSEGGGVDETGVSVNNGNTGLAANVPHQDTRGLWAAEVDSVGGADRANAFQNITPGGPNPFHAKQLPEPDPLAYLPVPTTANGANGTLRGTATVSNGNTTLNDPSATNTYNSTTKVTTLNPGVYTSIQISGGTVNFQPGIYIIKAGSSTPLTFNGGSVNGSGVMFYNTGSDFDVVTGLPDINDPADPLGQSPPGSIPGTLGSVSLTKAVTLSPINNSSSPFDGMLFYQRRYNTMPFLIAGNSSAGLLQGTYYGKWAQFQISGQGAFNAQIVAGSLSHTGQGTVTVNLPGMQTGASNQVFLVE